MDNEDDTFHFSAEDVGCKIICVVTYQEDINNKQEEWLSFGPIEFAPFVKQEIEDNIMGRSCQYTGFCHVNKEGKVLGNKIKVNTKDQIYNDSLVKENNLFKPKYYSYKIVMNSNTLFMEVGYNVSLEEKRERINDKSFQLNDSEVEFSLNLEDFRLESDCNNHLRLRMYWMEEVPEKIQNMELIFRDKDNGMVYMDLEFERRSDKEAFYVTHRLIGEISKLSIDEALRRFEFKNKDKSKRKFKKKYLMLRKKIKHIL